MNIGLLGGSFDPPHNGHLLVAKQIKKLPTIDEVWLLPAYIHPFQKGVTSPQQRFAMTKFLESNGIRASDFEIQKKDTSFTIDTLKTLTKAYPMHTFFWVSGSDQVREYPLWKNWKELVTNYNIIIYSRKPHNERVHETVKEVLGISEIPDNIQILDTKDLPRIDISSTDIRNRIKKGQSIHGLVPQEVEEYIESHALYNT